MLAQDAVPALASDDPITRRYVRHRSALSRIRRDEIWIGATALVAAMLTLPFAQSGSHGPEVAAVLAVAATALLAGQRSAIAIVVIAELLLIATAAPRAVSVGALGSELGTRIVAAVALAAIVPGLLAMRRAAAALVLLTGRPRSQRTCRQFRIALMAVGAMALVAPLL